MIIAWPTTLSAEKSDDESRLLPTSSCILIGLEMTKKVKKVSV